jgi:hypothetical protein
VLSFENIARNFVASKSEISKRENSANVRSSRLQTRLKLQNDRSKKQFLNTFCAQLSKQRIKGEVSLISFQEVFLCKATFRKRLRDNLSPTSNASRLLFMRQVEKALFDAGTTRTKANKFNQKGFQFSIQLLHVNNK